VLSPASKGTNALIQSGAYAMTSPQDVIDVLNLSHIGEIKFARQLLPSTSLEAKILQVLDFEPKHIDEICNITGITIDQISAALTMMELKGMVQHVGGMRYVSVGK
jgi:DNA processing protein